MQKRAAVFISRQALYPSRSCGWVRAADAAVRWCAENGYTVLTSAGMSTWELLIHLSVEHGATQEAILPSVTGGAHYSPRWVVEQFRPELTRTTFVELTNAEGQPWPHRRDQWIAEAADLIIPVSLRPKGTLTGMLVDARKRGVPIMGDFQIAYEPSVPSSYRVDEAELNPLIDELTSRYLVHWTRAAAGPWPDELRADYCRAVCTSEVYPHDALDTLLHIVGTGRLLASPRHMPGGTPTVSFSALPVREMLPLIRWRARYRQMSFEPYGIGIEYEAARTAGILPVLYTGTPDRPTAPSGVPVWRTQSVGKKADWRHEAEYRHLGDLDLGRFSRDSVTLFVHRPDQVERTRETTGLPVFAVTQ